MKKVLNKEEVKLKKKKIIIISMVCLLVLAASGFFIFENVTKRNFRGRNFDPGFNSSERGGNFSPINETTKTEITSFFENSPSSSDIDAYCKNNPGYCMYYCRQINSSSDYCKNLNFSNRNFNSGAPTQ